jgi:hypothetical protein
MLVIIAPSAITTHSKIIRHIAEFPDHLASLNCRCCGLTATNLLFLASELRISIYIKRSVFLSLRHRGWAGHRQSRSAQMPAAFLMA